MRKKIILILIIVLLNIFLLSCNGEIDKSVRSIQIQQGSFKTDYSIDEALNLSNAFILVRYADNSQATLPITLDMISDFDTRKTLSEGTFKVTYRGVQESRFYTVGKNESAIVTYARLIPQRQGNNINISLRYLEEYDLGIYALTFNIEFEDYSLLTDFVSLDTQNGGRITQIKESNKIKISFYNAYAVPYTQNIEFLRIETSSDANGKTFKISNIQISDGEIIRKLPDKTIVL